MTKEVLTLALEALERFGRGEGGGFPLTVLVHDLREALAKPDPYKQGYADAMNWKVQNHLEHLPAAQTAVTESHKQSTTCGEPVAWMDAHQPWDLYKNKPKLDAVPLYTTPPQPKEPEQEPVAHFGSAYINENGVHITTVLGPVAIQQDAKLYTTPPQRKPLTDEQEREAFEQHWYDYYHCGSISPRTDGTYIHPAIQKAWEAWQARAAHNIKGEA